MGIEVLHTKAGSDAFAWALNVATSVVIVFVNKVLLSDKAGHGFTFATTLCALHFLACAASIWVAQALGFAKRAQIPWRDVLKFAVIANISIASLNLSLLVNSVGFYQVAKLLIIPFVCVMEMLMRNKRVTLAAAASILTVVLGVAVVTVNDVQVNPLGLLIAVISVVSSGMQQIMCGDMQRRYQLSSHQLLSNTAYIQGAMLLVIGPYIDRSVSQRWILDYTWTAPALQQLLASCGLAVLVNISQFMCLGRFSAVTFQVLGHTKTILVLLASWWVFQEPMTPRKLLGMSMAVLGMVAYGYLGSKAAAAVTKARNRGAQSITTGGKRISATAEVVLRGTSKGGRGSSAGGAKAAAQKPGGLFSHPIAVSEDSSLFVERQRDEISDAGYNPVEQDSIAAGVVRRHRVAKA